MMRFTGRPLGAAAHGGMRTTATQKVQFFADNPTTTTIRWYAVPEDRPTMPYPSVFANEVWYNEVPLLLGMEYGRLPGEQGMKAGGPHYERMDPVDVYNPNHFCGTMSQWGGDLLFGRAADQGSLLCCTEPPSGAFTGFASATVEPGSRWSAGVAFDGSASVAVSAGSHWSAGDSFDGSVSVAVLPGSGWSESATFDGSVSVAVLPGSSWQESATFDGAVSVACVPSSEWTGAGSAFEFDGSVVVAVTPGSGWQQSCSFDGSVTVQITVGSSWQPAAAFGGSVSVLVVPSSSWTSDPAPVPGDSCESAGNMDLGTVYGPFTVGTVDWWVFPVTSGLTYHVTTASLANPFNVFLFSGDCSALTAITDGAGGGCIEFVAPADGFIHVEIVWDLINPATYTIVADVGPCP